MDSLQASRIAGGNSASVISRYVKGDIEPTIQKLLALEDLTGRSGSCSGNVRGGNDKENS